MIYVKQPLDSLKELNKVDEEDPIYVIFKFYVLAKIFFILNFDLN